MRIFEDLAKEQVAAALENRLDRETLGAIEAVKSAAKVVEGAAALEQRNQRALQDKRRSVGHDGEAKEPPRRVPRPGDRAIYGDYRAKMDAILAGLTPEECEDNTVWWPLVAPLDAECRHKLGNIVYEMLLEEDTARKKVELRRKKDEKWAKEMAIEVMLMIPQVSSLVDDPRSRDIFRLNGRLSIETAYRRLIDVVKALGIPFSEIDRALCARQRLCLERESQPPSLEERLQEAIAVMLPKIQSQIEAVNQRWLEDAKVESQANDRQMMRQCSLGPRFGRGASIEDKIAVG